MDIRDIKIDAPKLEANHLEFLFEKGSEQLDQYIKLEGLPEYPVDVNLRNSQVILKDFIGRIIEELFEGYESLMEAVSDTNTFNFAILTRGDYRKLLNTLQNANEEQADAIGFFIPLMIYSNILPEDIYNYSKEVLGFEAKSLNQLMSVGVSLLIKDGYKDKYGYLHTWDLLSVELISQVFDLSKDEAESWYNRILEYTPGFNRLSPCKVEEEGRSQLWGIMYQLNISRNILKNRPWKQTTVMTKELDFQESVVKSFIYYLGYLACNGFDQDNLVTLFNRKQALNLWRIKTGY